jgi:hypothetical protein
MERRSEVTLNELTGCGLLLRSIFFQRRMERRQRAVCPRCGKQHTVRAGAGASPRQFCSACRTLASDYYADYDAGRSIEIRGAHRMTVPLADEPGLGED